MGPAVISSSITQLNFTVITSLASKLPEGSISALRTANTLIQLPLGVFAMGVSMVILPTLSGLIARNDKDAFRTTFSQGLRLTLFLTIPAAVGLAVLREPLIRLLFQVGEFGAKDTAMAAHAVLFYAPGLISQSAIQILSGLLLTARHQDARPGLGKSHSHQYSARALFHPLHAAGPRRIGSGLFIDQHMEHDELSSWPAPDDRPYRRSAPVALVISGSAGFSGDGCGSRGRRVCRIIRRTTHGGSRRSPGGSAGVRTRGLCIAHGRNIVVPTSPENRSRCPRPALISA